MHYYYTKYIDFISYQKRDYVMGEDHIYVTMTFAWSVILSNMGRSSLGKKTAGNILEIHE